jgi:FG-GAP-like repeat
VTAFSPHEYSVQLPGGTRWRFLLSVFFAQILSLQIGYSQRGSAPFGAFTDLALHDAPAGMLLVQSRSGRPEILVSARNPNSLHTLALTDSGQIVQRSTQLLESGVRLAWSGDLDGDGVPDLVGLTEDQGSIAVLLARSQGYVMRRIPLEGKAERVLVADIDNDRIPDILLFGKTMAGITVLRGKRGGMFEPGFQLFQEISVIDAAVTDLNSDGIADIFLLNWLSNTLEVSFGISRGIFSGQVEINLGAEPGSIALSPLSRKRTLRAAITLPSENRIVVVTGNGAGEFTRPISVPIPGSPAGVQFALLNEDALPDLVTSTDQGIVTSYGLPDGTFASPTESGIGRANMLWKVADVDGDRRADLVALIGDNSRLVVAANGNGNSKVRWPSQYLVGPGPRGVALIDVNGDGRADVIVANGRSSTVSTLLSRKDGRLDAQRVSLVSDGPEYIFPVSSGLQSAGTVVLTHPKAERISIVRFPPDGVATAYFGIPTASDPYVLAVRESRNDSGFQILVRNRRAHSSSVSFSLFEQISGPTFVERSFQADLPASIRSLSVGRFSEGRGGDIFFLTSQRQRGWSTISRVPGRGSFSYAGFDSLVAFSDPQSEIRFVLAADLNGDGIDDLLLGMGGPNPSLGVAFASGDRFLAPDIRWIPGIRVAAQRDILVEDADGDGLIDIIALDQEQKGVVVLSGTGNGRFAAPRLVCRTPDAGGFALGALRRAGMNDLVVTDTRRGCIQVFYDPF